MVRSLRSPGSQRWLPHVPFSRGEGPWLTSDFAADRKSQKLRIHRRPTTTDQRPATERQYHPDLCLILVSYDTHEPYRLVIAANRDEFHARTSRSAHWWEDAPSVLGGRDLEAGGTWMGVTRTGRFAAVTNYSESASPHEDARSRGELVARFLTSDIPATDYLAEVAQNGGLFRGFSLLVFDRLSLASFSNRSETFRTLSPGVFGLANALLDTPWPKVTQGKERIAGILSMQRDMSEHASDLLRLLRNEESPSSLDPPHSDGEEDSRQRVSPIFIRYPTYGTRASTVLLMTRHGDVTFVEQNWDLSGHPLERQNFRFRLG